MNLNKISTYVVLAAIMFGYSSCKIEEIPNPNAPTIESIVEDASLVDLQLLAVGAESAMRNDMEFYYESVSLVGREYYDLSGTDPRNTTELLGQSGFSLDNNGFYLTRPYAAKYRAVKTANTLMAALVNTSVTVSDEDRNAFTGYAKTLKAYQLLLVLNMQYQNGIRVDVEDPDNLGAFLDYNAALAAIITLLNEANTELAAAGSDFPFNISSGFMGYDTPSTFALFNRAIAARANLYAGNNSTALTNLTNSFFDINGGMMEGPSHVFSLGAGDQANPLFHVEGDEFVASNSYVTDAEAGDNRLSKVSLRSAAASENGLSGDYAINIYSSNSSDVKIIRNEELLLIYAEANIGTNSAAAVTSINNVRAAAGLIPYVYTTDAALETEMLMQRRYSLFGEGHRWIDLRRNNRLSDIVVERAGSVVHTQFPRPFAEN